MFGFVSHASYTAAAAGAGLRPSEAKRRLRAHFAHDANPIAALFRNAGASFERRWNALNGSLPLGVATFAGGPSIRRQPRDGTDCAVRARLAAECIELSNITFAEPTLPLSATADALGWATVAEIMASLYAEPALDTVRAARVLGCSVRTLQRELATCRLRFTLVRQAIRISIAGFRLRSLNEPSTETAMAAGFYDAPHFNHAWRAACEMSPRSYRRLYATRAVADSQ